MFKRITDIKKANKLLAPSGIYVEGGQDAIKLVEIEISVGRIRIVGQMDILYEKWSNE